MESMMASNVENHSPEISGLLAANSGFALVEAAFIPVSLLIRPASLWLIAVISLGALATAAGVTMAGDLPAMTAVGELPAATEAVKNLSVQPVVLRGEPPSRVRRRS
jgi:hypothetical protein